MEELIKTIMDNLVADDFALIGSITEALLGFALMFYGGLTIVLKVKQKKLEIQQNFTNHTTETICKDVSGLSNSVSKLSELVLHAFMPSGNISVEGKKHMVQLALEIQRDTNRDFNSSTKNVLSLAHEETKSEAAIKEEITVEHNKRIETLDNNEKGLSDILDSFELKG